MRYQPTAHPRSSSHRLAAVYFVLRNLKGMQDALFLLFFLLLQKKKIYTHKQHRWFCFSTVDN